MDTFTSMVSKLSPLGIYNVTEDSNIYTELMAYKEGLDIIVSQLDTMLRECFFSTAESYGLSNAERLWGAVRDDLSVEQRREMLLARSAFSYDDFTPEGISELLKMLGISGEVTEYPATLRMVVDVSDGNYTEGQRLWIINQLRALLPAHLEVDAVFSGLEWEDIDSGALTFQQMERKSLTWDQIDLLR